MSASTATEENCPALLGAQIWARRLGCVGSAWHGYGDLVETVALGALGEKLLAEARSASSGRCSVTIHGGHVMSLRQTAIGIAAGHRLDEHENTGEITLQLLSGRARVVAAADEVVLAAGDYTVIPLQWEAFEALEDSVVLLTAAVRGRKD
jgi:quercetin dioxygenase-like cupin family protein